MSLGTGFRNLASLLDTLESHGVTVASADVEEVPAGNRITATIEVEIPASESFEISRGTEASNRDATASTAGRSPGDEPTESDESESGEGAEASQKDETERVPCTDPECEETFETERGMKIHRSHMHDLSDDSADREEDEEQDADEDGESGTDSDGRDESESDVDESPSEAEAGGEQAQREANGTALEREAAAVADDPDALADLSLDVDLPDDLTPADVYEAVRDANTVYEVQRHLDLDEDETMSLLSALDLLELVHGRVATKRRRERAKDEIGARILRHADGESAGA